MTKSTVTTQEKAALTETKAPLFKIKRSITLPLLKFVIGEAVYVKIDDAMFVGKELKGSGDKAKMEPATLVNCTNLETGEQCQLIIATVLKSILTEEFEDDSYVGKGFMITKGAKASGKSYNPYTVAELEL